MTRTALWAAGLVVAAFLGASASSARPAPPARPAAAVSAAAQARVEALRAAIRKYDDDAVAYYRSGDLATAADFARAGLKDADEVLGPDDPVANRLATTLGRLLFFQARYAESEPLLARVLAWSRRTQGDAGEDTLQTASDLAEVLSRQAKFAEAETLLRSVLKTSSARNGPDHAASLRITFELADLYRHAGRYAEDEQILDRIIARARKTRVGEAYIVSVAQQNLALNYQLQGRFAEAEKIFLGVLRAPEQDRRTGSQDHVLALNNLASLYQSEGRFAEATAVFQRAAEAARRGLGPDSTYTEAITANLAAAYLNSGERELGVRLLTELVARREAALGADNDLTLSAKTDLANGLSESGRVAEAEVLYRTVLEGRRRRFGPDHPRTLDSLHSLAMSEGDAGQVEAAQALYDQLVAASVRTVGLAHPTTQVRLRLSVANRLQSPRLATGALAEARTLVSAIRASRAIAASSPAAEAQGAREQGQQAKGFAVLLDAAWVAGGGSARPVDAEVFAALQDALAGRAGTAIANAAARNAAAGRSTGLEALVRRRQDLSDQWNANEALFVQAAGVVGADAAALRQRLATDRQQRETEMAVIDARLHAEFPAYAKLVRPLPISLAAAQALLASDEAFLLVLPSAFGTHVVAVSRDAARWARSDWNDARVASSVRRLLWNVGANVTVDAETERRWIAEGGPGNPFDRRGAYALHEEIVAPVAGVLAGKRHVFIVAGGALSGLPFGVLVTQPPRGSDTDPAALRATPWFADAHALVVIPSVQSLEVLRSRRGRGRAPAGAGSFTGYGDPLLDGKAQARGGRGGYVGVSARSAFAPGMTAAGAGRADTAQLRRLARLPGTALELEAMRQALGAPPGSLHLAGQATEAAFRSADLSHVRILALATHGLMAGELGGEAQPGLVFTPPAGPSDQDDGFLAASDVATLRLVADWVILSACNTAAGDGSEGAPGLSGLARAFFYAGARNLLVSHWPVLDEVASRITVDAIRRQRADPRLSRAEALQQAERAIRNDASHDGGEISWAHPAAWAPFSLIGDGAR